MSFAGSDRLRRRRLRHAAEDERTAATSWSGLPVGDLPGARRRAGARRRTPSSPAAAASRGARRTAARPSPRSASRPVESSCRVGLRDLSFVSRDVGYLLLADGSVFTTTDGGTQFAPRTAVPDTRAAGGFAEPGAIAFLDASKGYATSGGKLFQTLDGGISWRARRRARAGDHARCGSPTRQHGFAVGNGGLLLRSDDGGATWTAKSRRRPAARAYTVDPLQRPQLCMLTTQRRDAADAHDRRRRRGRDGRHAVDRPDLRGRVRLADARRGGRRARHDRRLRRRRRQIRADRRAHQRDVHARCAPAARPNTAYAPGADGRLAKTTDGGRTWSTGNVPTTADLLDVSFPNATIGYALDVDGGLFRTDNAGAAWKTLGTGSTRAPGAVLAPDASTRARRRPARHAPLGRLGRDVRPGACERRAARAAQRCDERRTPAARSSCGGRRRVARSDDRGAQLDRTSRGPAAPRASAARCASAQVAFASAKRRPAVRHAPAASGARRTPAEAGRC